VKWLRQEGEFIDPKGGKEKVALVTGPSRKLLLGERPALNMLSRASGVASIARTLRELKIANKWGGVIAATRKTTPG
jgi:nicotinate-nucleotide pyrophosphorylase (carboxylating)